MRYLRLYQTLAEQTADKGNLVKPYVLYTKENKTVTYMPQVIDFKDALIKAWCVENFDTDKDGDVSYVEAKKVTGIPNTFPKKATSFDEFQYFTSVTTIGKEAFSDCRVLSSITLPNSVTSIGENTFKYGGLRKITIPNSVRSIGQFAFELCKRLSTIEFQGTIAQWKSISKGWYWNIDIPSTTVITCTDGETPMD